MAASLISLLTLTEADVQRSIGSMIDKRTRPDAIADYVASIDWSGCTGDEPAAKLLGAIEHLSTELTESDIDEPVFWESLQELVSRPTVRSG